MIGKTISHYKILEKLGEGGMGVVYKAKDTKLRRTVALKFLTSQAIGGEQEKSRFIQEAQIAAALDHPNICSVYEIDEAEGQIFIAMAYIDGYSLREKTESGPLKIGEALDTAIKIAEGLQEAHDKGVIHRDIKSANVMVTAQGQVKIMDFGLAKSSGRTKITKTGTTMGTVGYMSPEQVRGEVLDHRSDIWSLGVLIYEMITGQLPFKGEHEQPVMYSILHKDPEPITGLRSGVPLEMERIVTKCLEKDTADRFQTLSDLRTDLRRLKRDIESGTAATIRVSSTAMQPWTKIKKPWMIAALGALAAVVLTVVFFLIFITKAPPPPALEFMPFTSSGGLAVFPCWSPDGNWIAYALDEAGNMDIWKKPVDGGQAIQLTSYDSNEIQPAWSPDGEIIAFSSDKNGGGIFIVHSEGGTPYQLTTFGLNPTWSPDNKTIAFDWLGDIYLVSTSGEDPKPLVIGTSATPYMAWNPDGKWMIFWNRTKGDIYVVSIDDRSSMPLNLIPSGEDVSGISWSKDGRLLVYSRGPFGGNKNLWKAAVDPNTGKPTGEARPLTFTITDDIQCALSPDGSKLAFTVRHLERHLWALNIDSTTGLTTGEEKQITFKGKQNYYPVLSPDEHKIIWTSHLSNKGSIYYKDFEEDIVKKITHDWGSSTREIGASFSPDGEQISFSSTVEGSYKVWRIPSMGSIRLKLTETEGRVRDSLTSWSPKGDVIAFYSNRSGNWDIWCVGTTRREEPKRLTPWSSNEMYPCWSPDGGQLAFRTDKEGNPDIWVIDEDSENPHPYVAHPAEEGWGAWSPDGCWFYFTSNRDGVFNVWAMPSGGGEPHKVTSYQGLSFGLPEAALFTKFAISSHLLVVPLESRRGDIYILDL